MRQYRNEIKLIGGTKIDWDKLRGIEGVYFVNH